MYTRDCRLHVQVGGAGLAVVDDPRRGIQFGAEGISIPLTTGGGQAKAARCRLGTYYARNPKLPEGGRSLFASSESYKGTELITLEVLAMQLHVQSCVPAGCHQGVDPAFF